MVFWGVFFWKKCRRLVVERRGCVGRVLCAFVLFRLVIPIWIWRCGVPIILYYIDDYIDSIILTHTERQADRFA